MQKKNKETPEGEQAEPGNTPADTGENSSSDSVLEKENAALKERMLRIAADAENMRKRAEREREDTAKYAISSFARDLVNVAENLKRALDNVPAETKDPAIRPLRDGVEMTLKELLSVFERHGIRRIDPVGEPFDHNFHQAVAQLPAPDAPAGTVVQVLQAGYALGDRLLRPAMVGVAKTPDSPRADSGAVDTSA